MMDERQIHRVERELADADAYAAAAIAVAAITRMGEIGRDAGEAFAALVPIGYADDPDLAHLAEGMGLVADQFEQ